MFVLRYHKYIMVRPENSGICQMGTMKRERPAGKIYCVSTGISPL